VHAEFLLVSLCLADRFNADFLKREPLVLGIINEVFQFAPQPDTVYRLPDRLRISHPLNG
jgi:hypothetical protein